MEMIREKRDVIWLGIFIGNMAAWEFAKVTQATLVPQTTEFGPAYGRFALTDSAKG